MINAPEQPGRPGMAEMMNAAAEIALADVFTLAAYKPAGAIVSGAGAITPLSVRVQISERMPLGIPGGRGQRSSWSGAAGGLGTAPSASRTGARTVYVMLARWPMGLSVPSPIPAAGAAIPAAPRDVLGARVLDLKVGDELYVPGTEVGKPQVATVAITVVRIVAGDQAVVLAEGTL